MLCSHQLLYSIERFLETERQQSYPAGRDVSHFRIMSLRDGAQSNPSAKSFPLLKLPEGYGSLDGELHVR